MSTVNGILDTLHRGIRNIPNFGELLSTRDREFLLEHSVVRVARPGEVLCQQYQRDNSVFILIVGHAEVTEEVQGKTVSLGRLAQGELFGEISALLRVPRIATVKVVAPSVLLEFPGEALLALIDGIPAIRDAVIRRYWKRMLHTALCSTPLLSPLCGEPLDRLIEEAAIASFPKGAVIVKQGEAADALYVINYGMVRVYHEVDGRHLNLAILKPGDYFGEWSLITGAPKEATVCALTQVETVCLDRATFHDLMQRYPDVWQSIDLVAHNRHRQTLHAGKAPVSREQIHAMLAEIEAVLREQRGKPH